MEERTNPAETAGKRQELEELEAERRYKSLVRECLADSYQPARLRKLAREVRRALPPCTARA